MGNDSDDEIDYAGIFAATPGLLLLLSPDPPRYTILSATDGYLTTSMTTREIFGRALFEVFPDNPADPGATGVRNLADSLERVCMTRLPDTMPLQRYDVQRPEAQGGGFQERYWSPVNSPVLSPAGELLYIVHRVDEVTAQVRAEAELGRRALELHEANRQLLLANAQLAESSESQFRALFDFMPQLGWTARADGFLDFYNRGWYEYTGLDFEQLQGNGWERVHDPQMLPLVVERWQHSLATGQPFELEFPLRRFDGVFRWFLTRCNPIRDADGKIVRWVGINTDIHERKQAGKIDEEARLIAESSERRFRFLAQASAALSESLDMHVTLRRVAELAVPHIADWCTVSALDEEGVFQRIAVVHKDPARAELVAEYRAQFPPGDHRAGELAAVLSNSKAILRPTVSDSALQAAAQTPDHLRVLRGLGTASCIMVPVVVRGQGVAVISLMRGAGERPFDGNDLSLAEEVASRAAIAIDNARLYREAQRRQEVMAFYAEASALLGSSLEYETTFQSLARLIVPRFADWCAVEVMESGAIKQVAMAHVDASKIALAHELQKRYPTDPNANSGTPNILRTGRSELYEEIPDALLVLAARDDEHLRLLRALGLRSALSVPLAARGNTIGALSLIWAESGRRYGHEDVSVMEELGRRGGIAVDNARLYRESQGAIRVRDEFLSIAGHELKTPLAALQLQVNSLVRAADKGTLTRDPERLRQRLVKTEAQGTRLDRLIDELLDVSKITAGRLMLRLQELDVSVLLLEVLERFGDDFVLAGIAPKLTIESGLVIRGDGLRLDQVFTNLISNALKYGQRKPVAVALKRTAGGVRFTIADNGIGIDGESQQRIFGRFERAVSERNFGGFGLGLWIAKEIVAAHGGTITVDSALGRGSTFAVELPLEAKP